jgi:enoyl-[acyl-carrier protein] reductase III
MQTLNFVGKTALITGGTKGLGLATAQLLAKQGVHLILTYRSDEKNATQVASQFRDLKINCETYACDLSEEGATERLFDQLEAKIQTLDFYIHNAAATSFKPLLELESHHIDKTMNITVKSFILGVKRSVKLMKPGAAIVTVSGMDTLRAVPRHGLLGAAKSALETLTGYFAHELATQGIRVNCVNPGFFGSNSTQKYLGPAFSAVQAQFTAALPSKKEPEIAEVAEIILFLCSEKSKWLVGQTLYADGGFQFALPLS